MNAARYSCLASVLLVLKASFTLNATEVDELRKSDSWGNMRIPTSEVENRGKVLSPTTHQQSRLELDGTIKSQLVVRLYFASVKDFPHRHSHTIPHPYLEASHMFEDK